MRKFAEDGNLSGYNDGVTSANYTYDEVGNILKKATEHGTYGYDYDGSSRLTGVDNPVLDDETYTYDNVGNRLTAAGIVGTWNYNANNELLGFADVEYEYDENGNMISRTTRISHKQGFEKNYRDFP